MDNNRQQIVDSIKSKSNILVTVSTNPSVDELSAALGLTILLNNMDKRATAVVSGIIPPAINFLEPNKTFENTADSLRDFIIALDKEKADHLRYKVEGDVVKIFITPYKTTLTQKDLDFSQGDYNVELVIAIGVKDQDHLDKALVSHGKILHDAAVMTMTSGNDASSLGSTDWHDAAASSLSEMTVSLIDGLKEDKPLLDEQIATALLTGIVSATDRFSNDRTSSRVMTMAAQLMAAGANQQLIAAKLEEAHDIAPKSDKSDNFESSNDETDTESSSQNQDGSELTIERSDKKDKKKHKKPSGPKPERVIELVDVPPVSEAESPQSPVAEPEPQQAQSQEVQDQLELEKQLAGLSTPPTGTMADIEKELQQASEALEQEAPSVSEPVQDAPAPEPSPLTAVSDAGMPGFEPAEVPAPLEPSVSELQPPAIINDHGTFSSEPPAGAQALNSIQSEPTEGESTIDPFFAPPQQPATPAPQQHNEPFAPVLQPPTLPTNDEPAVPGTPEGAAMLASDPVQPAPQAPPVMPELPPLPPLPTDGSLPPLPPPPPLPNFGQPSGPMPSGAVSADQLGDIFGDSSNTPAAPAPAPTPPEPGQFRIPGQ